MTDFTTMRRSSVNKHLEAIYRGVVDKSNVIGIRKAINAADRRAHGWSVSRTAPKTTATEIDQILRALKKVEPRVAGALVESGLYRLQNPRYKKRLASVAHIIAGITHFRLVRFEGNTPVYRACSADGSFLFKNVSWQSGGDGLEIVA
jgi:hypothetical protein